MLQETITHKNFFFSYWVVNFQMGNQITVTHALFKYGFRYTTHILCTL